MKSGFVGVVGRPNAGKSTLINSIVGKKVAITSNKPQTTRNIIHGIYNEEDTQIVFVDTPGIHKPNHKLGTYLNRQAFYSMDDTDIVLVVVDASEDLGRGDKFIVDKLKDINKPDFGDKVTINEGEVPVFWACGVTPQSVIMNVKPEIVITHSPGHMLITDIKNVNLKY